MNNQLFPIVSYKSDTYLLKEYSNIKLTHLQYTEENKAKYTPDGTGAFTKYFDFVKVSSSSRNSMFGNGDVKPMFIAQIEEDEKLYIIPHNSNPESIETYIETISAAAELLGANTNDIVSEGKSIHKAPAAEEIISNINTAIEAIQKATIAKNQPV